MDKRKYPRFKTQMAAEVNSKQGLLENVSKEGIKVKLWSEAVPKTRDVKVEFKVGKQVFNLNGVVRWCRRDKFSFQDLKEIGLSLEEPSEEFFQFVDSLSSQRMPTMRL